MSNALSIGPNSTTSGFMSDDLNSTDFDDLNHAPLSINVESSADNILLSSTKGMPSLPPRKSSSPIPYSASHSLDIHSKKNSLEIQRAIGIISLQPQASYEESIHALEHQVEEKKSEIDKLKQWITLKGIPAQKSLSNLQQKLENVSFREDEMKKEIQQISITNSSLQTQNETLTKQNKEIENRHNHLIKEHKSLKNLCNDIQRAYDECLNSFNTEKKKRQDLSDVIKDLRKLKEQYEEVNNDQSKKIEAYKEDMNDLREKVAVLEFACQELASENEVLNYHVQNGITLVENKETEDITSLPVPQHTSAPSTNVTTTTNNPRSTRALSAVTEDEEAGHQPSMSKQFTLPANLKINVEPAMPQGLPQGKPHPIFNRSTSFTSQNLEDMTRRYSQISNASSVLGPRHSLLGRIRSFTIQTPQTPSSANPDLGGLKLTNHDSMVSNLSTVGGTTPSIDFKGGNPYAHLTLADSSSYNNNNNKDNHNLYESENMDDNASNYSANGMIGGLGHAGTYSTMFKGRPRKRTISILTINTPRKRTMATSKMEV